MLMDTKLKNNSKELLMNLYFHDSEIINLEVSNCNGNERRCVLLIDYYNWEHNDESRDGWKWRKLQITFDFLGHIEWYVPDLGNRHSDILDVEYDCGIQEIFQREQKKKDKYPGYLSPIFDSPKGFLSIKFNLSNFDIITDEQGYLLLIGSGINLEWLDKDCRQGKIHIPAKN